MSNVLGGGGWVTGGASRSTSNTAADWSEGLQLFDAVRKAGTMFGSDETGAECDCNGNDRFPNCAAIVE